MASSFTAVALVFFVFFSMSHARSPVASDERDGDSKYSDETSSEEYSGEGPDKYSGEFSGDYSEEYFGEKPIKKPGKSSKEADKGKGVKPEKKPSKSKRSSSPLALIQQVFENYDDPNFDSLYFYQDNTDDDLDNHEEKNKPQPLERPKRQVQTLGGLSRDYPFPPINGRDYREVNSASNIQHLLASGFPNFLLPIFGGTRFENVQLQEHSQPQSDPYSPPEQAPITISQTINPALAMTDETTSTNSDEQMSLSRLLLALNSLSQWQGKSKVEVGSGQQQGLTDFGQMPLDFFGNVLNFNSLAAGGGQGVGIEVSTLLRPLIRFFAAKSIYSSDQLQTLLEQFTQTNEDGSSPIDFESLISEIRLENERQNNMIIRIKNLTQIVGKKLNCNSQ